MPLRENNSELADDALIGRQEPRPLARRWVWLWVLLGLAAAIPLGLTLASALTSPPHAKGVSSGHLVYLEADSPSEHTTTLRSLYLAGPNGSPRQLTREYEPQDIDSGVREWITQPTLSPDGTQVAYEKQLITLIEEKQSLVNQLWVMPLNSSKEPHLVLDLTEHKLKQIVGLAWGSDTTLLFLEDGNQYTMPTGAPDLPKAVPLDLHGAALKVTPEISATRSLMLTAGVFAYTVQTANGPQIQVQQGGRTQLGPVAGVFALAPSGNKIAYVPPGTSHIIRLYDTLQNTAGPDISVPWGWSVFGRRRITSLRWSPDGSQIAYTVSKPPVPDDEIFVTDIATRKTVQLPYRTGPAAWDWGR